MFYVITQPFLKILTWKFCTHIHQPHCPLTYCTVFLFVENFAFEGESFEKGNEMLKILEILEILEVLKILEIRDFSFIVLLILCHMI